MGEPKVGQCMGLRETGAVPDWCHTSPSRTNFELCEPEKKSSHKDIGLPPNFHKKSGWEPVCSALALPWSAMIYLYTDCHMLPLTGLNAFVYVAANLENQLV